jgi:putative heme degradation protein
MAAQRGDGETLCADQRPQVHISNGGLVSRQPATSDVNRLRVAWLNLTPAVFSINQVAAITKVHLTVLARDSPPLNGSQTVLQGTMLSFD